MEDSYDLWEIQQKRADIWLNNRPICARCGRHIQDDSCVYIRKYDERYCLTCIEAMTEEVE